MFHVCRHEAAVNHSAVCHVLHHFHMQSGLLRCLADILSTMWHTTALQLEGHSLSKSDASWLPTFAVNNM